MKTFKAISVFLALMAVGSCVSMSAFAGINHLSQTVDVSKLPYEHIADFISEDGETEHQFLLRIAPELRKYSDKTGFEACGVIAKNATHYGVIVGSSHSHIACLNDSSRIPVGMVFTDETIHSHGKHGLRILVNEADIIFMGNPFDPPRYIGGFSLNDFSDTDYDHPGYLATTDGLIYQHGKGTTVVIK